MPFIKTPKVPIIFFLILSFYEIKYLLFLPLVLSIYYFDKYVFNVFVNSKATLLLTILVNYLMYLVFKVIVGFLV